ncbi:unnamed protein product [Fraxinus pennsylvanica]|uniref:EF-hand domain-containing protein n=1 Tax=Fraxinus pennsylvanica TaxID=56036 RepID=A0AAD1ZND0_9LAMI|nr:unnamed protein product [Fraxinus pennsylvanica]
MIQNYQDLKKQDQLQYELGRFLPAASSCLAGLFPFAGCLVWLADYFPIHRAKEDSNYLTKDVSPSTLTAGIIWLRLSEAPTLSYEIRKPGFLFPLGFGWKKEYVRYSSTAAAGQPEFNSGDDKNEEPKIKGKLHRRNVTRHLKPTLQRDYDGKVTPEEVASAAMYLKDTLDKEGMQELISNLSKDREGKIRVEDIIKLANRTEDAEAGRISDCQFL